MRFNAMGFKFTRHHSPEKMAAVIFIFSKEGGNKKATLSFIFIKLICLAELKRRLSLLCGCVHSKQPRVQGKALYSSVKCLSKPKWKEDEESSTFYPNLWQQQQEKTLFVKFTSLRASSQSRTKYRMSYQKKSLLCDIAPSKFRAPPHQNQLFPTIFEWVTVWTFWEIFC